MTHAISRSQLLLPFSLAGVALAEAEAALTVLREEAGVSSVVLTLGSSAAADELLSGACGVGARLGVCVGVEVGCAQDLAAAAAAGARFVLLRRPASTADESAAQIFSEAARIGLTIPIIPVVGDNTELDSAVASHGSAMFLWDGEAGPGVVGDEEYGGTLRFICDSSSVESAEECMRRADGSGVLGVWGSWLAAGSAEEVAAASARLRPP